LHLTITAIAQLSVQALAAAGDDVGGHAADRAIRTAEHVDLAEAVRGHRRRAVDGERDRPAIGGDDRGARGAQGAGGDLAGSLEVAGQGPGRPGNVEAARTEQSEREILDVEPGGAERAAAFDAELEVHSPRAFERKLGRADDPRRAKASRGELDMDDSAGGDRGSGRGGAVAADAQHLALLVEREQIERLAATGRG